MRELLAADAETLAVLGIVAPKQERAKATDGKKNISSGDNPLAMDLDALYEVVKMKRELGGCNKMAVFECKNAYYQLYAGQVNNCKQEVGYDYNHVTGEFSNSHFIGTYIKTDNGKMNMEFYTFCEGEKHNRVTITDEKEIQNMRDYIKRRKDDFFMEVTEV